MPRERLPKQAFLTKIKGKRPAGRPRTRWEDYIEDLRWNRLGLQPSEMLEVVADRDCDGSILSCHERVLKEDVCLETNIIDVVFSNISMKVK